LYQALDFRPELTISRVVWLRLQQSQARSLDVLLNPVRAQEHTLCTEWREMKNVQVLGKKA
jgi:hypothetical protein